MRIGIAIGLIAFAGACGEVREVAVTTTTGTGGCEGPNCEPDSDVGRGTMGQLGGSGGSEGSGTAGSLDPDPWCALAQAPIPDADPDGITSTLDVPDLGQVTGVTVAFRVRHESAADLRFEVSHGEASVLLLDQLDCAGEDMEVVFDDHADSDAASACMGGVPSLRGAVMPTNPLEPAFVGQPSGGAWQVRVSDHQAARVGVVESWCVALRVE